MARIQSSTQSRPQRDCRGKRRQPPRCRRGNDCDLCSHNKGGFHWAPEYSEASVRRSYPLGCRALLLRRASQIRVGMVLWERLKLINSSHGTFTHLSISCTGLFIFIKETRVMPRTGVHRVVISVFGRCLCFPYTPDY